MTWNNRAEPLYDHSHEYEHANCLHDGPNVSHLRRRGRRLNYITIFCAICLAVWLMATIAEHIR